MFHMRVIVCFRANWRTFQPKLKKINPYPLLKKKKKKKKKRIFFKEIKFLVLILKKFQETKTKKIPYISGNGTFQSTPRKFHIFQKIKTPKKIFIL